MSNKINLPHELVMSKIYEIRGVKVMIDRDLANLYEVETRVLKQAVRRNLDRFPNDFMFEMTKEELEDWKSQIVISNGDNMGLRHAPFCFTEQGVSMLSSVLNSKIAIQVNIQIIRTFAKMREMILSNKDILIELDEIRTKVSNHDEKILMIFDYLRNLLVENEQPKRKLGYKTGC
jgi:hypothetical protein